MKIKQADIKIEKTARYFLSGEISDQIKEVWFVCHGYGQLASYFLKNFEAIAGDQTLIVSCEGLHRFYSEGFSGRIGASWMTKEDRLNDIQDYISYLNKVYDEIGAHLSSHTKIVIFGFSQGGATVCRWLEAGHVKADHLVLWASVFPPDLQFEDNSNVFKKTQTWILCGDEDEFTNEDAMQKHLDFLREQNIPYRFIPFKGRHRIYPEVLRSLQQKL